KATKQSRPRLLRSRSQLAAGQRVDVLGALRQVHRLPAFAAILRAEHFAVVARREIDLLRIAWMWCHRHDGAVYLHLVEPLPALALVLAAVHRAVLAGRRNAQRRIERAWFSARCLDVAPIGGR